MLAGDNEKARLVTLNAKTYAEQAKWYLDAFWDEKFASSEQAREEVWDQYQLIGNIDKKKWQEWKFSRRNKGSHFSGKSL